MRDQMESFSEQFLRKGQKLRESPQNGGFKFGHLTFVHLCCSILMQKKLKTKEKCLPYSNTYYRWTDKGDFYRSNQSKAGL